MSRTYQYDTPEQGAQQWHVPLNENFERIGAHLDLLNWRLKDVDGIDFHERVSGDHDYKTPTEGTANWHLPLNDNFDQIATEIQTLDERISEKDGQTPGTYEYNTPDAGTKDWHLPIIENFEQIAEDVAALDDRVASLESSTDPTIATIASGMWDDPSIWDTGSVPADGDNVLIRLEDTVELSGTTAVLDWVRVDGGLRFDPSTDTHLRADTVLTSSGSVLEIGTPANPVQQDVEARITFRDTGPINEDLDPKRKSRGLIVQGDATISGAEKTPWTTVSSFPSAGDSSLSLSATPTNWSAGDRIVIPGFVPNANEDEERTIESISGDTVQLDTALDHDHSPPQSSLDAYVLNLSRSVVLASESTDEHRRGHVMFMTTGTDVRWVRFEDLGRTNKDQYLTNPVRGEDTLPDGLDPNPAARYPFHYHHTGIGTEKHLARGLAVDGSPGWGIVNHHAHADITDSVTYDVLGAGFVAEGGNERGSFRRCFALRSAGSGEVIDSRAAGAHGGDPAIDDFGHAGHGFWLQSPLVEVTDCVAAGHRHQGFVWWLRPLLEGDLAEGTTIDDSRVTFHPNLPWQYCNTDRPLFEAIEQGRFENDQVMRDTEKIPSTFAEVKKIQGNEAFASAGGADFSRHNFKWKHERFSDFNVIDDMTVHSIGPFIDDGGTAHVPDLPKHRASGHQGRGGNVGVSFRYTSNVTLSNSRLIGASTDYDTIAVPFHDYLWTSTVDGCTVENWTLGVDSGEHRLTWVRNSSFSSNTMDVEWVFDNVGPAILDGNDLNSARAAGEHLNQKAPEVLYFHRDAGMRVDGRTLYPENSAPDSVPFPDEDSLDSINNIEQYIDTVDDETNLVGLTNSEMLDQYGICINGKVLPSDAVSKDFAAGAKVEPATQPTPSDRACLDSTNARSLGAWETVSEPDAAGDQALRWTGSSAPSDNFASIDFDCQNGTYDMYVRVWPEAWNGDDVYFRIDGGSWKKAEKLKSPIGFQWEHVDRNDGTDHTWTLSEGTHTLEFYTTNDDVKIDEIFIAEEGNAEVLGAYGQL